MSDGTGLGRHAAAYTLGGALQLIATLLVLPLMAAALDTDQFGLAVTLQLITQLAVHIGSAGLPLATTREYFSPNGGPGLSSRLMLTASITGLVASLVIGTTAVYWVRVFDSVEVGWALWLAVAATIPRAFTASALGHLKARHSVRSFLSVSIVNTVGAQLLGVSFAWVLEPTATSVVAGYLLGSLMASMLAWVLSSRPTQLASRPLLRRVARYALPTVPHAVATMVLQAGDRVVIEPNLGLGAVGRYQVAYLLASLPIPALVAFNNAWTPRMAAAEEDGRFLPELQGPGNLLLVAIPAIGALGALAAPVAIDLGLPAEYDAASLRPVVAAVSTVALSFTVYVIASQVLVAKRKTAPLGIITPLAAAVNIGLNLWLVPRYGLTGAAWATTVTYVLMSAVPTVIARRYEPYRLSFRSLAIGLFITVYALLTQVIEVSGLAPIAIRVALMLPVLAVLVRVFHYSRTLGVED